jgi:small subunit ribosomal protein S3
MKRALDQVMKAGAIGAKIELKGRLDGIEIARKEKLLAGNVPLQTFRANIDYSRTAAFTTYGAVGIKVWIYKGEVFEKKEK